MLILFFNLLKGRFPNHEVVVGGLVEVLVHQQVVLPMQSVVLEREGLFFSLNPRHFTLLEIKCLPPYVPWKNFCLKIFILQTVSYANDGSFSQKVHDQEHGDYKDVRHDNKSDGKFNIKIRSTFHCLRIFEKFIVASQRHYCDGYARRVESIDVVGVRAFVEGY